MRSRAFLGRFGGDAGGVAAVEMALISSVVAAALLNVVEVGRYAYLSTQITAATQAGAHAAIVSCNPNETPVTINCPNVNTAITAAIQGGGLRNQITLHEAISERWYCLTAAGALQDMAPAAERPSNCSGAGDPSLQPALYVRVRTEYTYEPIFPGLTITERFADEIIKTAWMRVR
jgi:Flp pilus assembly protein TadG